MLRENPQDRAAFEAAKLQGELQHSHTSMIREYVSRKVDSIVQPYNGRYGHGYTVKLPNWRSSQFSYCEYWLYGKASKL